MRKLGWLLAAVALWATSAMAQTQLPRGVDYDARWYIAPSLGVLFSDTGSGPMGSLALGRSISPWFGVEVEGGYGYYDVSDLIKANDYKRGVLGFNLLGYLTSDESAIRPYLVGNLNGHYIHFLQEKLTGGGAGAGIGLIFNLSRSFDLRTEVRYNLDFASSKGAVQDATFNLWSGTVGLRYRFGPDPNDDDGDGVPNWRDRCPDTPKGVVVNADGCPLDSDGDGVPDYLDKCPNTPKGIPVGADGCEIDSDGDGVPDRLDKCPNTPRGVQVDAEGCPLDSDGDGVPDYLDKCPGTPPGTKVNADGCSSADSDGDGIPDDLDRCKNTPKGIPVGPDGCPLDSDGDGIPDYLDECPHTPPGAKVLPNGCALVGDCRKPRPGEQVDANGCALEKSFILKGVKFEFDSDRLTAEAKRILDQVAQTLQAYPNVSVEVAGHTDNIGSDSYNLGLSERRAIAVKRYLVEHSVKADHMRPVGYGETRPIDSNETDAGRENNRRVELTVIE
ncbi:Outer membrane protein OmpA and related peptidoglycan-associated (lipo)proteins [Solimonas aquatica]|uniref:Outer membrane protein OmpA and related peptidoglycan-associated (Lipo)proteins n=1 Tax=Solimonas aquatica TaxID=489703 RepID=A0A1H9KL54_9GAMM|nr:OmpA family protein [Solimonas aquatica]SEQ99655.1 Outer membrane protein OmpA and related peptidoglycan-associated (lipo)proteins [Solimonas aquatica]